MKLETSNVKKIVIRDLKDLDPISLYLEDYGKGQGQITIICFNKSWSNFWGSMGTENLTDFILSADNHYLSKKLNPTVKSNINDEDGLENDAKRHIIELRKECEINKKLARDLYDDTNNLMIWKDIDSSLYESRMYAIYGDEWYDCLPQKSNPEYQYFCRILDAIKEALKQMKGKENE